MCIHNYLTRVPDSLHSIRGCKAVYIDQVELKVCKLWMNENISASVSEEKAKEIQQKLEEMYVKGVYTVRCKDQNSKHAHRVVQKYEMYFSLCAPYLCNDRDLTARLTPEPIIEYIESML